MEQVAISSGNGQTPSDHNSTTDLLDRLNFPAPTRSTVVKVAGNGVPRAVDQGRVALLSGFEMRWSIGRDYGSGGVFARAEANGSHQGNSSCRLRMILASIKCLMTGSR